jgi:hypothetical protein
MSSFDQCLVEPRWTKTYYKKNHVVFDDQPCPETVVTVLLCHKMNTSVFVLSWQNTDTSSTRCNCYNSFWTGLIVKYYVVFLVISFGPSWFDETLIKGQTYLVVARNTTLQKWLRAVVYCLIYLLTHWFLLNLNITNLFLSILISRIKKNSFWTGLIVKYYVVFLVISFGPSWFDETLIKGRHILMFSEEEYMTTG